MAIGEKTAPSAAQITFRSILLGALAVPLAILWVVGMEEVYDTAQPTTMSIFFHAVLILIVLVALNKVLRRWLPRFAFNRAEMLVVYIMISATSGLPGIDFMAVHTPSLAHPFWYASPANSWQTTIWSYLPSHLVVSDEQAVRNFYMGNSTLYNMGNLRPWLGPGLIWASLIVVTQLMCLGINIILRRQWTDYEKLTFPIIQLPLEITARGESTIWRNKLMWLGFGLVAAISIINQLHVHWPPIPEIHVKVTDISNILGRRYALAIINTFASFYPFVIGLAFLLPTDLSFSCWFFYVLFRLERVVFTALGYPVQYPWTFATSTIPAVLDQGIGGYIVIVGFALWSARRHLASVWAAVWRGPSAVGGRSQDAVTPAEAREYQLAMGGIALGMVILVWFATSIGMPAITAFFFFLFYLVINTAITRIRAQLGPPVHDLHFSGPDHILRTVIGTNEMSGREMAAWALFFGFNRAYRGVPMPHQLEGIKMTELIGADRHRIVVAEIVATVIGCYAAVWAILHFCYREGAESMAQAVSSLSGQGWGCINGWINNPGGPNWVGLGGIIFGIVFGSFLMLMNFRFLWWPFHPIGYAIAANWAMNCVWMPILIGWLWKSLTMRYAGPKLYRTLVPLAMGLIIGDFTVGGLWTIVAMITHQPQYSFWIF